MRVIVEYTEEAQTPFAEDFFQAVATRTLGECGFGFLHDKDVRLNVVAVTSEKIRELNRTYRNQDRVTDILSFGEYESRSVLAQIPEQHIFLGELFFCPTFIMDVAQKDGVTFEREMVYVFAHGVLHLVGFNHEEAMFVIQDRVTDIP